MICVSLSAATLEEALAQLGDAPMGEARLDLGPLCEADQARLYARVPCIATCRPGGAVADRAGALEGAVRSGARFVDLELDGDPELLARVLPGAKAAGCGVILSFHDFAGTPPRAALETLVARGFELGADLVKVACTVREPAEAARLLGLLDSARPLVVVGMGPAGRLVRVAAPLLGSPFTFAAPDRGRATAPGQPSLSELRALLAPLRAPGGLP